MTKFPPHGEYILDHSDKCIYLTLKGAFNKEGAAAAATAFNTLVLEQYHNCHGWGVLVDLSDFELATADSLVVAKNAYHFALEHGQKYEAIVGLENTVQKEQIRQFVQDVYQDIEFCAFDNISSAKNWLKNKNIIC